MNSYPAPETLEKIARWEGSFRDLAKFVCAAWEYPDRAVLKGDELYLSTGGWSGNEDIISALEENLVFWACCWRKSEWGGHHRFRLPKRGQAEEERKGTESG